MKMMKVLFGEMRATQWCCDCNDNRSVPTLTEDATVISTISNSMVGWKALPLGK
jgi:hypothetical protein